jgi:6-phosphogluconolactonase (cycloisomerase 2 family)
MTTYRSAALRCAALLLMLSTLLLAACGGGPAPTPTPAQVRGIAFGTSQARLYAGPNSADAGSTVSATAGGTGTATAAADGSFTLTVSGAGAGGAIVSVQYIQGGAPQTKDVTLTSQAASVNPALFATGQAPNDIALGADALYVANSLDNTVISYSLATGTALQTQTLPVSTSPSYLSLSGNALWVSSNGSAGNTLTGLRAADLSQLVGATFQLVEPTTAFIGPMEPLQVGTTLYVPRNEIKAFGATTTYGPGIVSAIDISSGAEQQIFTVGKNPQALAYDNTRSILYVTTAGEIQFDQNFVPSATTDSFIEAYDVAHQNGRLWSASLGKVGAGRITLSHNGATAYLGNALTGDVFKVDLLTHAVLRGKTNPIHLTDAFTYSYDVQFTPDFRYLLVTSFNTDELYVIDPATDTLNPGPYPAPFRLGANPALLSGAGRIAVGPAAATGSNWRAYVDMGVANAIASVDL